METYEYLVERRSEIEDEVKKLERDIKKIPQESIWCVNSNGYIKWYSSGKGDEKKYLSKRKDRKLAEKLAYRKYASLKIKDLELEKLGINRFLNVCNAKTLTAKKLFEDVRYNELLMGPTIEKNLKFKEWMLDDYEKNANYPEKLIHQTELGYKVRSKSEERILHELNARNIPFRYEAKLMLVDPLFGETDFYPDFTCVNVRTGEMIYWEHLGGMSSPGYIDNSFQKLALYAKNGIIPGINLILTCETKDRPLDPQTIIKTIEFYFGQK